MGSILLLEDDAMIASGLVYALQMEGYEVFHATKVREALEIISGFYISAKPSSSPEKMLESKCRSENLKSLDLAILDMQLPDGTGFDVSRPLKERGVPVIFLTVVDEEAEILKAFEEGAEDYVVKPFRIRELLARVRRTLGKQHGETTRRLIIGQAAVDVEAGKVFVNGQPVELTSLEYRLLLIFATNRGILLTRNQILEKIWDAEGNFVEDNTLTVYVKRLRGKLGDAVNIETVRGIGYRVD